MPLILSLKKGQDFFVADVPVLVEAVFSDQHFRLRTKGKSFDVVDSRSTEILPDVFVSAGTRSEDVNIARAAIEAPREVLVLRGDMYRSQEGVERRARHQRRIRSG